MAFMERSGRFHFIRLESLTFDADPALRVALSGRGTAAIVLPLRTTFRVLILAGESPNKGQFPPAFLKP